MYKVLIAHSSEELRIELKRMLSGKYDVHTCSDGITALSMIDSLKPECLILDLSLPNKDGFAVLEESGISRPPIVLATAVNIGHYVTSVAEDLGIGFIASVPCNLNALERRLDDMVLRTNLDKEDVTADQQKTATHLLTLGFHAKYDGYMQLRTAIPMFAKDPAQRVCKEIYPAVAVKCGFGEGKQVERSIRSAIDRAWKTRNVSVWQRYFPDSVAKAPSNKEFIAQMTVIIFRK